MPIARRSGRPPSRLLIDRKRWEHHEPCLASLPAGLIQDTTSTTIAPTINLGMMRNDAPAAALTRRITRFTAPLLLALLAALTGVAAAKDHPSGPATALREQFTALRSRAEDNPFRAPLYLQAQESENRVQGDVWALIDLPFREARPALERLDDWCRILILHINVKYCQPADGGKRRTLTVGLAPKYEQSLSSVNWVRFSIETAAAGDEYLQIVLRASSGPFGTSDYRMSVELVPFEGRSLMHLSYGYSYGVMATMAMQAYLATLGRDKVGFTVVGQQADGQPVYVDGMRGVIERNVMRYYFAFDAYLGAQRRPAPDRLLKSLQDWFDATERYPRQLREVTRNEYLEMKLREFERQQAAGAR